MNNSAVLRTVITFAIIVPLAIVMGYMLANPLQYSTFASIGVILAVIAFPLLLRWRQPLLLLSWNMGMVIPFIKGEPGLWLVMAAVVLTLALFERALTRFSRFGNVWSITLPLMCFVAVVLITAKLTGGIGLRAFGSHVFGGKKYVVLLGAIAAYFALVAWPIPPQKARLYVGLFFLGAIANFISDLFWITPSSIHFLFWFFPPSGYITGPDEFIFGVSRMAGLGVAGQALWFFMLFRYGIRGIFLSGRPWRLLFLFAFFSMSCLGGFRTAIFANVAVFAIQFFLEGLHKTRLLAIFATVGVLCATLMIPLASKMPYTFQRALAFVPLLQLDAQAKQDAEGSSKWRFDMWAALLPQVPKYLLLGKGYAVTLEDYQMMGYDSAFRTVDAGQQGLALSGDYHNGPLSIVLPFGIWGVLAFLWFLGSATRVLYCNYRYCDPSLRLANTFVLALFITKSVMFLFIYGAISTDMWYFAGLAGLSVSLNSGMCRKPAQQGVEVQPLVSRRGLLQAQPSFQR